jgi:hypothetical protein
MATLTDEAREYCKEALMELGREYLAEQLGFVCVEVRDDDDDDDLAESVLDSIEAGDLEFDWGFGQSKCFAHHVQMLWLDIDEVWE